ncbi:hypothetical protein Q7P35_001875 [Cladosporium inversicolor]
MVAAKSPRLHILDAVEFDDLVGGLGEGCLRRASSPSLLLSHQARCSASCAVAEVAIRNPPLEATTLFSFGERLAARYRISRKGHDTGAATAKGIPWGAGLLDKVEITTGAVSFAAPSHLQDHQSPIQVLVAKVSPVYANLAAHQYLGQIGWALEGCFCDIGDVELA